MTGGVITSTGPPVLEVGSRFLVAGDGEFVRGCGLTQAVLERRGRTSATAFEAGSRLQDSANRADLVVRRNWASAHWDPGPDGLDPGRRGQRDANVPDLARSR